MTVTVKPLFTMPSFKLCQSCYRVHLQVLNVMHDSITPSLLIGTFWDSLKWHGQKEGFTVPGDNFAKSFKEKRSELHTYMEYLLQ